MIRAALPSQTDVSQVKALLKKHVESCLFVREAGIKTDVLPVKQALLYSVYMRL